MFKQSTELAAVMRRFMEALQGGDGGTVRGMISQRAETLFIGLREVNWLYGVEAREVAAAQVEVMAGYERTFHRIEAYENGATGWGAVESTVILNGEERRVRTTGVFALEEGTWRIVQWHASTPTPEVLATDLPERLGDLLESLDPGDLERMVRNQLDSTTVALLITDIEDSTSKGVELGDLVWTDLVQRHLDDLSAIATARDGVVVKTLGDGALIAFGTARDAVQASGEIHRRVAERGGEHVLRVRVGIHIGEAVHADGDYFGYTVNKTARIAAAAGGGETLASSSVVEVVEDDDVTFGPVASLSLKGLPGQHSVYPVVEAG